MPGLAGFGQALSDIWKLIPKPKNNFSKFLNKSFEIQNIL